MGKTFRKNKITPKKLTFDELLVFLKSKKYETCIERLINTLDSKTAALIMLDLLNNSKYKAYNLALKNFNVVINDFLAFRDINILEEYKKSLLEERFSSRKTYAWFCEIRLYIIELLIGQKPYCFDLPDRFDDQIGFLTAIDRFDTPEEFTKTYQTTTLNFICKAAEKVWPEQSKGLSILYGKN